MQLKIWKNCGCKLSSQTFECHWSQSKIFYRLAKINWTNILFQAKKICHGCQCLCHTTVVNLFKQQAIDGFSGISSWLFFTNIFLCDNFEFTNSIDDCNLPRNPASSGKLLFKGWFKTLPTSPSCLLQVALTKGIKLFFAVFFSNLVLAKGFRFHSSHLTQFEPCPQGNV